MRSSLRNVKEVMLEEKTMRAGPLCLLVSVCLVRFPLRQCAPFCFLCEVFQSDAQAEQGRLEESAAQEREGRSKVEKNSVSVKLQQFIR